MSLYRKCDRCGEQAKVSTEAAWPNGWDFISGVGELCAACVKSWEKLREDFSRQAAKAGE